VQIQDFFNLLKSEIMRKYFLLKYFIRRYFYVVGIIISFMSCNTPSGILRIWAVDDSEKIKQDDLENPLAISQNNAVWKDNTVYIFGARNEIIAPFGSQSGKC
jgi:hypothetical protein